MPSPSPLTPKHACTTSNTSSMHQPKKKFAANSSNASKMTTLLQSLTSKHATKTSINLFFSCTRLSCLRHDTLARGALLWPAGHTQSLFLLGLKPQTPPKGAALWKHAGALPQTPAKDLSSFGILQSWAWGGRNLIAAFLGC